VKKEPGLHRVAWDLEAAGRAGAGGRAGEGRPLRQRPAVAVPPVSGSGLLSAIPPGS